MLRRRFAVLAAVVMLAGASPAFAGPGGGGASAAGAQEQFAQGQKRFDANDYAGALELFRKSLETSGSPNARLYVARCLRQLGKIAEAYEEMSTTVRDATARAQSEAKYVPTRDAAAAELALLEPKVGKIVVAIADAPPGTRVRLGDATLAPDRVGTPVAIAPGTVHVVASAPGQKEIERDVVVSGGETKTVALRFSSDAPVQPSSEPPTEHERADTAPHGGGVRTAGFVVAGLGVAGLAVFGVSGLLANAKYKQLQQDCGGTRCTDLSYASDVDAGKRLDLIANVALVAGGIALATGVVLIAVGGPSRRATSAQAALTVRPGGAAFVGAF